MVRAYKSFQQLKVAIDQLVASNPLDLEGTIGKREGRAHEPRRPLRQLPRFAPARYCG
jgi:hypothetical protein